MVINHADIGIPGEVIALEKVQEVEAHLWAISFNRKQAAVTMAFIHRGRREHLALLVTMRH
jgi:hypothetical protein